jgi:metal-dependent amidase/aminoacylase/carboxypeptidase family protein
MRTNRAVAAILSEELRARGAVVDDAPRQGKGSIDAGNVSRRAPAVHAYLPAAPRHLALHTREFGEATAGGRSAEALLTAVAAMAASALRLARDPGLREKVRAEFDASPAPRRAQRWPLLTREPEERVEV